MVSCVQKKEVYMKISENTRKAYSEVDVFLNLLPEDPSLWGETLKKKRIE